MTGDDDPEVSGSSPPELTGVTAVHASLMGDGGGGQFSSSGV